jgi:predicted porin
LKSDPFGVNNIFSTNILWAQTDAQTNLTPWASRMDNAILYISPTTSPIQANFMYAPGEVANSSSGKYTGANLSWSDGPLWVGYGYQKIMSGTAAAPAVNPVGSTSSLVAVNYDKNEYRFGLSRGQQASEVAGSAKANILNVHAKYLLEGKHAFTVSYGKRTVENSPRGQQVVTLGYGYILSKRTELYARVLQLNNDANASVTLAQIPITANSGADGKHYGLGLTHRF